LQESIKRIQGIAFEFFGRKSHAMEIIKTSIPDVLLIEPRIQSDGRGFFMELFQSERYAAAGVVSTFVQDNLSRSMGGVLRGLHLQNPNPQGKLVTIFRGSVLDVAVDVRVGSPTYGKHVKVELSEKNRRQLWIPRGFAHGFLVLSETADVFYKCDELYSRSDEIVLRWNDPSLGIDWGHESPTVSERDSQGQTLSQLSTSLPIYAQP
jgi:dTDP-4-dehydrorhamnose 3,5-epimerase